MIKRHLFLVLFLLSLHLCYAANNSRIDSLLGILYQNQPDTARIRTLLAIADVYYRQGNVSQSTTHCKEAIELSKRQKDSTFLASSYAFMGGTICNGIGDFTSALDYLLKAYPIAEKINNRKLIYSISNGLGNTYIAKKNMELAYQYYSKAYNVAFESKDTLGVGITLVGLGNVNESRRNYDLAIEHFLRAADCFRNRGRLNMYHTVCQNIVSTYLDQKLADKALMSMNKIMKQVEEDNNKYVLANTYQLYGEIYFQKGDFDKSLDYYYKSIAVFKSFSAIYDLERIYNKIAEVYSNAKRNDSAYHYMQLCLVAKDSIYSAENSKLIAEMQEKYESAKKEEENKLLLSQNELAENHIKQQQRLQLGLLLFLVMAFVFSFFLYRSNKQKQKNNQIILKQKEEVELQKALLQVKNTEVLDSINYAKRLQEAILPSARAIKKYFPHSFVLYKPKDIVAGDFYWMEHLGRELEAILNFRTPDRDLLLLAVADCTGHGVPGAIVSVVCSNALNRTVKEFGITEPGKILDKVRELVAKTFVRDDSDSEVRDGMDISLISLKYNSENDSYTAEWAGANNPIWIVKHTSDEHVTQEDTLVSDSGFVLEEIKADKQAIGRVDSPKPFTTHSLPLNKGDMLYLFTDGYADQFGGKDGKKFKYRQLKEIILKNAHLPMKEQGAMLAGTLEAWRGNLEQVDDILIIGITL